MTVLHIAQFVIFALYFIVHTIFILRNHLKYVANFVYNIEGIEAKGLLGYFIKFTKLNTNLRRLIYKFLISRFIRIFISSRLPEHPDTTIKSLCSFHLIRESFKCLCFLFVVSILAFVSLLVDYSILVLLSILVITSVILLLKQCLLYYRMKKGFWGNNAYESIKLLRFAQKVFEKQGSDIKNGGSGISLINVQTESMPSTEEIPEGKGVPAHA